MPYNRSSVDEQVVKYTFDNSNFDSNISNSINALSMLDMQLNQLNKADLSGIESSLSKIASAFTAKGQIMIGVCRTLGRNITGLAKKFKNELFSGIKDGLGEYKQIIDSTETIYQNVKQSGATITDVNNALDELNDYADKTIYNFSQMTRMIGIFSSAGVSLNKSVSTIKGLANAAALVGANSERASIAWNAVARALSSGTFTNVTWRSLELSNIAGQQFNKVITEVARANKVTGKSGKNIDEMIKKYGSLRLTLSEGWLNKDIFTEAMQIMSGDLDEMRLKEKGYTDQQIKDLIAIANSAEAAATQVKTFQQLIDTTKEAIGSGWASSFRILIGDLEQAKKMFTRISVVVNDFIDNNAKIRNKLFKEVTDYKGLDGIWKTGRENFQETIENMLAVVKTFLKSVKTGFLNIFPVERIASAARKVLDVIQKATRALVLNKEQLGEDGELLGWDTEHITAVSDAIKDLIRFFRGLASAVDIAWMAFSQPLRVIIDRIPFLRNAFDDTNGSIISALSSLGKFGDKITALRNAIKNTNFFEELLNIILDNIDEIGQRYPIIGALLWVINGIKTALEKVKNIFNELNIKPMSVAFGALKFVLTGVWNILNFIFGLLKNAKNAIDWSWLNKPKQAILNFLRRLSDYGRGLISFETLTKNLGKTLSDIFSKISETINKIFKNKKLKTVTVEMDKSFSNLNTTVSKTGKTIAVVWDNIKKFFIPIGQFFKNIVSNIDFSFDNISKKIALIGGGITAATLSISVLVKTLKKIKILDNINDILLAGLDVIKAYQREMQSKMILNIAISIGILATSLAVLSFIPYDRLENGLVIFSSFMATLALTLPPILTAMAKFNRSIKYTRKEIKELTKLDVINNTLNNLIGTLGNFGHEMASAFNKKMIGAMFKDIAMSIFILVGAIAALALLIKFDGEAIKQAFHYFGVLIVTLTACIVALTVAINIFSKTAKNTKASIGTFASFFKLSGVATVILSIAAAITILVGALAIMTRLDSNRLEECFYLLMSLTALIGIISVGTAAAASTARNIGNIKKISVSFAGAMAGIALVLLAMKPIIAIIQNDTNNSWLKSMGLFTAIISQFTLMAMLLLFTAKKIGGQTTVWQKLNKTMIIMTASITALAGTLAVIGMLRNIPDSVVVIVSKMTDVLMGILVLLGVLTVVISNSKSTFSGNFVKVIEGISISISAVMVAIGVMSAGIAALFASLASINISGSDATKASDNIINKLQFIATTLRKALPALRKIFYNLGAYAGSMFTAFLTGFITNIVETGETYNSVAEKVVNLLIDILGKVTAILSNRKDDVKRIIRNIVDLIGGLVTEVLNDVFKKNSPNKFTEEQVLKFLGFGGATIGGGAVILKLASNFNTLANSVEKLRKIGVKWNSNWSIGTNLFKINDNLVKTISNLGLVKSLGNSAASALNNTLGRVTGKSYTFNPSAERKTVTGKTITETTIPETLAAIGAVAVAIKAVEAAVHGVKQQIGDEAAYIRSDIQQTGNGWTDGLNVLGTMINDRMLALQVMIEGMTKLGEIIVTVVMSVVNIVRAIAGVVLAGFSSIAFVLMSGIETLTGIFKEKILGQKGAMAQSAATNKEMWESWGNVFDFFTVRGINNIIGDWTRLFHDEVYDAVYDGAKYAFEGAEQGALDGYDGDAINKQIMDDTEKLIGDIKGPDGFDVNSPSKVMREIYHNVMLGAIQGVKDGEKPLFNSIEELNAHEKKLFANGAEGSIKAWNELVSNGLLPNTGETVIRELITGKNGELVSVNEDILNIIKDQKEALEGLNEVEAQNLILTKMRESGMAGSVEEITQMQELISAILAKQADHTKVTSKGIEDFANTTIRSVMSVAGKAAAADEMVIKDTYDRFNDLSKIAEQHKEELIGKKKEEVVEILKQEAIKAGLTAKEAEDTARLVAGQLFAEKKTEEAITKEELEMQLKANSLEYKAFQELQDEKTAYLKQVSEIRQRMVAGYASLQSKIEKEAAAGNSSPQEIVKKYYNSFQKELGAAKSNYESRLNAQKKAVEELYTGAGMSAENAARKYQDEYDKALNIINSNAAQQSGSFISKIKNLFGEVSKAIGVGVKDPDLSYWNLSDTTETAKLNDTDTKSAIDTAADLKEGLEANRADLTPVFDLDKLESDANKANGIVMSSLMAAQNASIGDYINKDSELNPFMKDRWQNVYNFTQNNYSPKALSRIDIYRQTQRQISMSRGF